MTSPLIAAATGGQDAFLGLVVLVGIFVALIVAKVWAKAALFILGALALGGVVAAAKPSVTQFASGIVWIISVPCLICFVLWSGRKS